MGSITPALAGLALCVSCALTACTELPTLGTCGNGIVEETGGEDCDEPDGARCLGCRLVCDLDLPADGACPDGARCCLAGQFCGHDQLCRAPSGLFQNPTGYVPFPATQIEIQDVDLDGIGDAFGVSRTQVSFLYGAVGVPTRAASAPIPTQSRPDSQVIYAPLERPGFSAAPAIVASTARGFAVLVADGGRVVSPALPELELEELGGSGQEPDRGIAVAAATAGELIALVGERRSDTGGTDRLALRVFRDRQPQPTPDTVCGVAFPTPADVLGLTVYGEIHRAPGPGAEHAIVGLLQVDDPFPPGGPIDVIRALCVYRGLPITGTPRTDLALPANHVAVAVRAAALDGDACPEVVAELVSLDGNPRYAGFWDLGGPDCAVVAEGVIAGGRLLGAGDLDGDGRDEVLVGRSAFTDLLGTPVALPDLVLPDALDVAVVADVNRDGRADIAGIVDDSPDLVVVLRVDAGYAPRTVASVGALRELVTGDFDADTYPDLAALETSSTDVERVVVAFGGPTGPQGFDSIGRIPGAHGLVAHVDQVPAASSDAFADLLMINTALAGDEISQFNGSATRALTSQIDLTGPPPGGDDGAGYSRTVVHGELVPPRDDPHDFCVVTFGTDPGPGAEVPFAWAFCVGGQGVALAIGRFDDAGAFSTGAGGMPDAIDPGEAIPMLTGADLVVGGAPVGALVALRRDLGTAPELVLLPPPPPVDGPPGPAIETTRLPDLFVLPAVPDGYVRIVVPVGLRALQLDGDADSELIVTLLERAYDPADELGTARNASVVYRVDLAHDGTAVTASAAPLLDPTRYLCSDAALATLAAAAPDGAAAASGPALVLACTDSLQAWYRGADGALLGPYPSGATDGAFGPIAVGDLTGDRLDDIAILVGAERDTYLAIMAQCPAHDRSACSASVPVDDL